MRRTTRAGLVGFAGLMVAAGAATALLGATEETHPRPHPPVSSMPEVLTMAPTPPEIPRATGTWSPLPPSPTETPFVMVTQGDDEGVYYASCAEARRAGAAPLHRGDPGYRAKLDSDHDGTACE
jgi:hypothetical protein